jgi:hypothetical protein
MAQLLINSRMSAEGHRPICQDTGIAIAFLKVGMDVRWDADLSVEDMVDEGVRRAYAVPRGSSRRGSTTGRSSPSISRRADASTSTGSRARRSRPGKRATGCCSPARSSPAATPPTSASLT